MIAPFEIITGNTAPALRYEPELGGSTLEGAVATFDLYPLFADRPATIISDSPPVLEYAWQPGDTDAAGAYFGRFTITHATSRVETVPSRAVIPVRITRKMGAPSA